MISLTSPTAEHPSRASSAIPAQDGGVTGAPHQILRLEGALVLIAATAFYVAEGGGLLAYGLLFFTPDVFMLGYLRNTRLGAVIYNLGHSILAPALLFGLGLLIPVPLASSVALIWIAHIGFDRAFGYGLKYPDAFRHTHLGS